MNIFVLGIFAHVAASLHCDKHVVKMILETTQILYAVVQQTGLVFNPKDLKPYKVTHKHHPCTLWASACAPHAKWLLELGLRLSDMCFAIYGTTHASSAHLRAMLDSKIFDNLPKSATPTQWKAYLVSLGVPDKVIESCMDRVATINPPHGCNFGVVCADVDDDIRNEIFVYKDKQIDCVATYRRFYAYKGKRKFVFTWAKQLTPPPSFGDVFKKVLPNEPLMTDKPKKSIAKVRKLRVM